MPAATHRGEQASFACEVDRVAGVVGVMFVAWAINHRGNGFFIFRPGEGWEYVMTLGIVGSAIGALGPGRWSLDEALDLTDDLTGL